LSKKTHGHQCPNCGFKFILDAQDYHYCLNCGQDTHNPRKPILHYMLELVESLFHFDNKAWLTIKTLIFKPGRLTKDFIENRRARYTPPTRLFFFTLVIFIVAIELAQHEMVIHKAANQGNVLLKDQLKSLPDNYRIGFANPYFNGGKIYYSVADLKQLKSIQWDQTGNWLKSRKLPQSLIYRFHLSYIKQNINSSYSVQTFQQKVVKVNYWLIILIIPYSALLNYLFFFRRQRMYYDSMILTIHFYTFSQVLGIVLCLINIVLLKLLVVHDTALILFTNYFMALVFNMMPAYKLVFGYSWFSTIIRGLLLSAVHLFSYIFLFWTLVALGLF
jgi:hypothetical protein